MRLDVTSPQDFYKYYAESYVKSKVEPRGVFFVRGAGATSVSMQRMLDTGKFGYPRDYKFSTLESEIYFGLPPLGMIAYRDVLFFLAQDFKRSGARGLSRYRGRVYILSENALVMEIPNAHRGANMSLAYMSADPLFAREALWPNYTESFSLTAISLLEGDAAAVAINKDFGACHMEGIKYPVLCYKTDKIGELRDKDTVFVLPFYEKLMPIVMAAVGQEQIKVVQS